MKRYRQTVDELLERLSPVETSWLDEHAEQVVRALKLLPGKRTYTRADLAQLLIPDKLPPAATRQQQFAAGLTVVRLFLDLSKDEFTAAMKQRLGDGIGITRASNEPGPYYKALEELGVLQRMAAIVNKPVSWTDLLIERLKSGRGSAIKGQRRGRFLEDFVENLVTRTFGKRKYDARCQFVGATGTSTEKTDFAIPSKQDPAILIEVKAYGATGSKQTDVIGDITRIVNEKRGDTHFLLITDGMTWRERVNDLRKLVKLQNQGRITRIYTQSMVKQLETDLKQLKREHGF